MTAKTRKDLLTAMHALAELRNEAGGGKAATVVRPEPDCLWRVSQCPPS
jgi:hypothetical protein